MAIIWVTHELAGCTVVIVAANHCGNSGLSFICKTTLITIRAYECCILVFSLLK